MERTLRKLNELNQDIGILSIEDRSFLSYGKVLHRHNVDALLEMLDTRITIGDAVVYEADAIGQESCPEEVLPIAHDVFGDGTDLQVGWVYGRNTKLNALEYHKCAEALVVGADMIMMMGLVCEIKWPDGTFDISKSRAYYAERGSVIEISPWCLHYTPIHVRREDGFKCVVILPKGTNAPIDYEPERQGEGRLMMGRNTWLIAHPDDAQFRGTGAHFGLKGRNIEIRTL